MSQVSGTGPNSVHSFSVIFEASRGVPIPQGTYRFEHAELGPFPLFVVPIGVHGDRVRYEAVFTGPPPPAPIA